VNLDVNTLLAVMLANVFAMAIAVPAVMGWHVSPAARNVLGSAVSQALAWASFLLAKPVNDRLFSTLWIALLGVSFVLMWRALCGWLGPRPGRQVLLIVAVLTPAGYGISFDSYAVRVGWSNMGLAFQMCLVCMACISPAPHASRRWRGLIVACLGSLAVVTVARGILGAFFTDLYSTLRTAHPVNVVGAVLNHIALTLTTIGLLVGWHEEAEHELRKQADTDGLTGLLNRRAWHALSAKAIEKVRREGGTAALLMLDIDHFKGINDRWGHETGDRALQLIAKSLRECARRNDLLCRYGGEEFCLLLLGVDDQSAREVDERLRSTLRLRAAIDGGLVLDFSSGLATLGDDDSDVQSLLRRADVALYAAKAAGRGMLVRSAGRRDSMTAPGRHDAVTAT
jgi:diguanylate cyclase (GGDEF)-like protein